MTASAEVEHALDPDVGARRRAWIAIVVSNTLFLALAVASVIDGSFDFFNVLIWVFPIVGSVILARQPRNTIGWVLMLIGALALLAALLGVYALYGMHHEGGAPGYAAAAAITSPMWAPIIGVLGIYLVVLFPDGHPPSPRWRWVAWVGGVGILGSWILLAIAPGPIDDQEFANVVNPLTVDALRGLEFLVFAFIGLIPIALIGAAASLVSRYRRSEGTLRLQLKWLTAAAAIAAALYALAIVASASTAWMGPDTPTFVAVIQNAAVASFALIPIAIGFAILKYRLYDIDVVINKTLVYGAMAVFITAVYVAIVVGIGNAVGGDRNLALSILATALVAVAFQPVRERVQKVANRLVYGKRATPYEVLSEFSEGMAHAVATEELLPHMARIVAEGTGAARVEVWLQVGPDLVREATWPDTGEGTATWMESASASVPVRHQGEVLGVIGVTTSTGTLTPTERKVLDDLSSQAGLVLRNVRLVEELRTSRQRLVAAQDEERRRLERDLHDGAQQRLVAIALALRMARGLADPEEDRALGERLEEASAELGLALSELREFARGIHPTILTERGLLPALQALTDRSTVPATLDIAVDERLPPAVEAAAYLVASHGISSAARLPFTSEVTVRVERTGDGLLVAVEDDGAPGADGPADLQALADRVAAVDGRLSVRREAGTGGRLEARIPLRVPVEAAT